MGTGGDGGIQWGFSRLREHVGPEVVQAERFSYSDTIGAGIGSAAQWDLLCGALFNDRIEGLSQLVCCTFIMKYI